MGGGRVTALSRACTWFASAIVDSESARNVRFAGGVGLNDRLRMHHFLPVKREIRVRIVCLPARRVSRSLNLACVYTNEVMPGIGRNTADCNSEQHQGPGPR